ncbi:sulfonate transport system ATP-binding protein [Cupriavidus sp. YR651]|uniref:ABC transporter ATP-binding protein n=1 Tax=Cupriavidus sp. YR651 TaxID=1855315 RepID=UPI00088EB715|nr:ABC transporter ATP-binding protein [Cupriavidus sp. YR651]SDD02058.1 sulfonate transport system ATP-binding protein [Cupriavidus sp. YR651]
MPHAGTLNITHLHKQYEVKGKALPVLDDISLSIAPGEFVSIVGASGCGKSTLLRLVAGLEDDYRGEIRVDGRRVVGTSLQRGIVFQEHRLFPWLTVSQNIALALINSKISEGEKFRIVHAHIELVGLNGFENAYPYQLSGGMSQRVAIARALVTRPDILLLDEPFGALDALTRAHLQQELRRIWQTEGITMILVTHDVEEAVFLGDRVVVMEPRPGRIRRILQVELPHPRDRASAAFARVRDGVMREFGAQQTATTPEQHEALSY